MQTGRLTRLHPIISQADSAKHELFEGRGCSFIIFSSFPSMLQLKPIICWRVWGVFWGAGGFSTTPSNSMTTSWPSYWKCAETKKKDVFGHADSANRLFQRCAIARAKVSRWKNMCCVEGIANGPLKEEKNEKKHKRSDQRNGGNPDFRAFRACDFDLNWRRVNIFSRVIAWCASNFKDDYVVFQTVGQQRKIHREVRKLQQQGKCRILDE